MKILHFCAGLHFWNGMANTARQFMAEEIAQGHESFLTNELLVLSKAKSGDYGIVYIHGAWLPVLWSAAKHAKRINAKLIIRPAGSYDPVRLGFHRWKKILVAFFERRMLRRADVLLGTCEAEAKWIKDYVGNDCLDVEITDLRRFFKLGDSRQSLVVSGEGNLEPCRNVEGESLAVSGQSLAVREGGLRVRSQESGVSKQGDNSKLNVLYLGRRHPLKGVEFLETAVAELNSSTPPLPTPPLLKIVSNAFGEELEKVWEWCDVLVLPTLSENFGLVVAEALERGKRVITTDGAPAWGEGVSRVERVETCREGEIMVGYGGRLIYLKGYREGTKETRVELLKKALEMMV